MNPDTARWPEIPTEARNRPVKISTFDGETVLTGRPFYTQTILLVIGTNSQQSMISCEIANAGKYDLIIMSGWWQNEDPLRNLTEQRKYVFEEAK